MNVFAAYSCWMVQVSVCGVVDGKEEVEVVGREM